MTSLRADVLLWAQRVLARKDPQAHVLLEIKPDAGLDDAQAAFHRIARLAHPDLHRGSLNADELERVTTAYSRCAAAYQEFRTHRMGGKPVGKSPGKSDASQPMRPQTEAQPQAAAAGAMTSKALVYYRKAELALRRGDLRGAVLQLKMAIAADPTSQLLRAALAEVEAEVGKKP